MKKPHQKPYICFPASFRIPVYSEKDPQKRVGYKSVTVGRREFAMALECHIDDVTIFEYRKHKMTNPAQFVHFTAKDLWRAFPDDFENPSQVGKSKKEESYYGD